MRLYSVVLFLFLVVKLQAFRLSNDSVVSSFTEGAQLEINDSLVISSAIEDTFPPKVSNVFGLVPSKSTTINGWAKGWFLADDVASNRVGQINGLYTNIVSLAPIIGLSLVPHALVMPFFKEYGFGEWARDTAFLMPKSARKLNGFSLSVVDIMESYTVNGLMISGLLNTANLYNGLVINGGYLRSSRINGVIINGFSTKSFEMNGLLISGIYSEINTMRGLQIGVANNNHQTFGLQIGLFNKTNKLKGVQLGLWNKNGKLGLPFLNVGW